MRIFGSTAPLAAQGRTQVELYGRGVHAFFAEDYALNFPAEVRFVNAILSGSNGQVDFNNIGFTAEVSDPSVIPIPAAAWLFGTAIIGFFGYGRRRLVG